MLLFPNVKGSKYFQHSFLSWHLTTNITLYFYRLWPLPIWSFWGWHCMFKSLWFFFHHKCNKIGSEWCLFSWSYATLSIINDVIINVTILTFKIFYIHRSLLNPWFTTHFWRICSLQNNIDQSLNWLRTSINLLMLMIFFTFAEHPDTSKNLKLVGYHSIRTIL